MITLLIYSFRSGTSYDEEFFAATEQGRIFSPGGELKWRSMNGLQRVIYLGKDNISAELKDCSEKMESLEQRDNELILWGVRTNKEPEWIEQQVPHRFSYPFSDDEYSRGRIVIEVESWCDSTGAPKFSRYRRLKEIVNKGET